jgi:ribonuclease BN (tRNA processing enzyme)
MAHDRPMTALTFVGTGEAFDPALPNTSLLYAGHKTLLLDCGYSIPHAFWRISTDPSLLDAIYITHIHADHSFGLPSLLLWMRIQGRKRPLKVISGPGVGAWLEKLTQLAYPGSFSGEGMFAIEPTEVAPDRPLAWDNTRISVAQSTHGVRNLSIRIEEDDTAVCYSGDGIPTDETRALFEGADLLVHECYWPKGNDHGHANVGELMPMARDLQVKNLALLHLGFDQKERIRRAAEAWTGAPRIFLPVPGETFSVSNPGSNE